MESTVSDNLICKYQQTDPSNCNGLPLWCIAYICDRCEKGDTAELCETHYTAFSGINGDWTLMCGDCNGTISYVANPINGGPEESVINKTRLP